MHKKQLFVTRTVTQISDKDLEGVGTVREDDKGNVYRWVKSGMATNSTSPQYGLLCYDGTSRSDVKRPSTNDILNIAGVAAAALPGGKYGWIQVKGVSKVVFARNAANSTQTYNSLGVLLPHAAEDGEYHAVSTNAIAVNFIGPVHSHATVAGNDTTRGQEATASFVTEQIDAVLNCKL